MNNKLLLGSVFFALFVGLAYFGKTILLPLIFAFLLWIVISAWQRIFTRIKIFGRPIPHWMQVTSSTVIFVVALLFLTDLLAADLQQFSSVMPTIETNLETQTDRLAALTGFDVLQFARENFASIDVAELAQHTANGLTSVFGVIFTTLVYLLFIFGEQKNFTAKLKAAAGSQYETQQQLLSDILASIEQYISIKTGVSLLTAVLSYIIMTVIGLEFAFVWAFIIFVMNFIPSIGSLIATAFPVLFALINFSSWWQALALLILIGGIQLYVGNILEPKYMGKRLNISPLLVIIALFFWGAIWGIAGMFLSVPLTVIIMIVLSRIPATRNIGIWMSGDGVV